MLKNFALRPVYPVYMLSSLDVVFSAMTALFLW